ncbi:MAG: polyprenyl diphosphate synthase [Candidatus Pelagibacter bacterium]|jgi:undecaprenyl diphosphate synthase|nr:polyprenyl diphosphate synthase [Candidatus Pelagibacter bacterium]
MNPIKHVAIIMDGNGRWGIKNKGSRNKGHTEGLKTIENIITESLKQEIRYLTLYTFSTENWKRPKQEITFLFKIFENFLLKKTINLVQNGIKFNVIGNKKKISKKLQKIINDSEKRTQFNNKLQINVALNYGSKDEIITACKTLIKKNKVITEKNINDNLYTKKIPNPDILIRTGNTNRLSNFLLWQIAYTEIFFIKKFWPEFSKDDYKRILKKFRLLKRNFGSI